MTPPQVPGVPGTRLPAREGPTGHVSQREQPQATPSSVAPPDVIQVKGRGWGARVPPAAIGAIVTAALMYLGRPAPTAPEDVTRAIKECRDTSALALSEVRQARAEANAWQKWAETQIGILLVRTDSQFRPPQHHQPQD